MSKDLNNQDKNILEFRPNISFIEPNVETVAPNPIPEPRQPKDVLKDVNKIRALSKSANVIATALQARADIRAQNMYIDLQLPVDAQAITAMRKMYPDADPMKITYQQYRGCKENIIEKAFSLTNQGLSVISPEEIQKARDNNTLFDPDAPTLFDSDLAKHGGLRPEADKKNQVFQPVDVEEYQDMAIKILVNFIWKNFIRKALPLPPGVGLPTIPEELVKVPEKFKKTMESMEIKLLGGKAPKKKEQPEFPTIDIKIPNKKTYEAQVSALNSSTAEISQSDNQISEQKHVADSFVGTDKTKTDSKSEPAPAPLNLMDVADCQTIQKTFERAAMYCATEESVFAMLTPILTNVRSVSQTVNTVFDGLDGILVDPQVKAARINLTDKADDEKSGENALLKRLKECIPCEFDFSMSTDFLANISAAIGDILKNIFEPILAMLKRIADMFNQDPIDICSIIEWFKSWLGGMCIPDLRKIIAALMALIVKMAFELTSLLSLMITLVVPLLFPFLMGIMAPIEALFAMIIQPLECIIRSIINILSKLDYQSVFDKMKFKTQIGPAGNGANFSVDATIPALKTNDITVPIINKTIPGKEVIPETSIEFSASTPGWSWSKEIFNWDGSFDSSNLNPLKAEERRNLELAEQELAKIRKEAVLVDQTNRDAVKAYAQKAYAAEAKAERAKQEKEYNAIQDMQNKIRDFGGSLVVLLNRIVDYIRRAVAAIQAFLTALGEEIQKILQDFIGGDGTMAFFLQDKLLLIQVIASIVPMIKWLSHPGCNNDDFIADLAKVKSKADQVVFVDEDGSVRIETNPDTLAAALETTAAAYGIKPTDKSAARIRLPEGTSADLNDARQKVNSLIQLTGDPVLDTDIIRTINAIVQPVKAKFNCPLSTSIEDAEKVNKWIMELSMA